MGDRFSGQRVSLPPLHLHGEYMEQLVQDGAASAYVIEPDNEEEARQNILAALSTSLAKKRRDAVSARATLGIEIEWIGDEEFYQGYDDANRHEYLNTASKPVAGGGKTEDQPKPRRGSTVFPNITQHYVDAAAARVGDMLLPTDDRNFAIEPTPIPDLLEGLEALIAKTQPQPAAAPIPAQQAQGMGVPGMPQTAGAPAPVQPAQPEPQVQLGDGAVVALSEAKARFNQIKAEAKRKADKAQTQIDDWLTECQYAAEMRKVIDDSARLGSGVIKGPFPVSRKARKWERGPEGAYRMVEVEEIKPESRRIDPWDLFPEPACGESIHNGSGIWERDRMTGKQLGALADIPGYNGRAIRRIVQAGPGTPAEGDARNLFSLAYGNREQFEVWYYYGDLTVDELEAAGCACDEDAERDDTYPAMIVMVNDVIIKASLNVLDDGQFPYDVIPWKRRPGMPWGMGVGRQMRVAQRIVVAATRNLMDNAGLAGGPLITLRRGVEPDDGTLEIYPLKVFVEGDDISSNPTGAPVTSTVIPMMINELMTIIQFGMKMAEDVTGLPMLLQGQQGSAPDTFGGMTILNNNANAVLRRVARLFDSSITEPHIRRYYVWNMVYGEDDDSKGDMQIVARGSTALVERDIQGQELVQLVEMSLNPAFGLNPKKTAEEYLKSRRFDPAAFQYTKEEQEQMANQPPPEDPRITAAKLMADATMQRDKQKFDFEAAEAEKDRANDKMMAELDAQLEERKQAGAENMSLADVKAMISTTVLKLQAQERMSMHSAAQRQVATPPTEPAGRAAAGHAYEQ